MTQPLPFYLTWCAQGGAQAMKIAEAREDFFVLTSGRKVYDMVSTSFQASFGHSHAGLLEKIRAQTHHMMAAPAKAAFDLKGRATDNLHRLLKLEGGKTFYTVSGAESVENALKMARQCTGRRTVCARERSYHGASLGALSVTGDWRQDDHIFFDPHVLRIPEPTEDPDGQMMRELIIDFGPEKIAAIIVETVTGANGVIIPPATWWQALTSIRADFGIKIILDEVLTGFGRTGHDFAFHQFDITPDFVTMGKAITGGYVPFGAVWTGPEIAGYFEDHVLSCGLTSYAHPLGLAAMEAVLEQLTDPRFRGHVALLADTLEKELSVALVQETVAEVRQAGLLAAIDLVEGACPSYSEFLEAGVHVVVRDGSVILAPPLMMKPENLRHCMGMIRELIRSKQKEGAIKPNEPRRA